MGAKIRELPCPLCGGEMVRSSVGNCAGISLGCFLILLAIVVGTVLFPLGLVVAAPLIAFSLFCGGKRVWRCRDCGHVLDRA